MHFGFWTLASLIAVALLVVSLAWFHHVNSKPRIQATMFVCVTVLAASLVVSLFALVLVIISFFVKPCLRLVDRTIKTDFEKAWIFLCFRLVDPNWQQNTNVESGLSAPT